MSSEIPRCRTCEKVRLLRELVERQFKENATGELKRTWGAPLTSWHKNDRDGEVERMWLVSEAKRDMDAIGE